MVHGAVRFPDVQNFDENYCSAEDSQWIAITSSKSGG
jgi:hypothetical protein